MAVCTVVMPARFSQKDKQCRLTTHTRRAETHIISVLIKQTRV